MFRMRTRMLALLAAGAVAVFLTMPALTQQPRTTEGAGQDGQRTAEQAIRQAGKAYAEAMTKGDVNAVLAQWAPDADYIDETGAQTKGRDAIAALFKKSMPERKGQTVKITLNSLKMLRPDVAMEDGTVEFTAPTGVKETNRYAVVWTKTGDKWLISSARDLPSEVTDLPSLAYPQLKPLEWMVGEWHDDSPNVDVSVSCRWAPNKTYLLLDYTLKRENSDPLQVNMRIGWDPLNGRVRSWVFDSQGGYAEGIWHRDGNRWLVGSTGYLPDGGTGGATYVYEYVDHNNLIWKAMERDIDGVPLADAQVKFVRKNTK